MFVLVFILTACTNTDTNSEALNEALEASQQDIVTLNETIATMGASLTDMQASINMLNAKLESVQSALYDGTVIFEIITEDARIIKTVAYKDADDLSAFDLLVNTFDVEYSTSEWGVFVNGIETLIPQYGQFISMQKNDAMMLEGIGTISYQDGDIFTFELVWWDQQAKVLNEAIQLTLEYYLEQSMDDLDYQVIMALDILNVPVTLDVSQEPETGLSNQIKQVFMLAVLGLEVDAVTDAIFNQGLDHHLFTMSLMALALNANQTEDYASFQTSYLDLVNTLDVDNTDLDTLSMVLMALNAYNQPLAITETMIDRIKTDAFNNSYGDNAASFSMNILGLLSQGINPENIELISTLLAYQDDNGTFYYQLEDENTELMFSTPQSFLALVMMQSFLNQGMQPVNPYTMILE